MHKYPVHSNIEEVDCLDDFIRDILQCKKRSNELLVEKVHSKNRDIYGSLNKIWSYLEDINGLKDDTINVDINTLLICTQQTVLLLGQTIKSILCYRRYNAFFSVMSYSDSKMVLNDQSNEMSEEGYPFGKKLEVIFQRTKGRKLKQRLS